MLKGGRESHLQLRLSAQYDLKPQENKLIYSQYDRKLQDFIQKRAGFCDPWQAAIEPAEDPVD
jgi:hypothetical protein